METGTCYLIWASVLSAGLAGSALGLRGWLKTFGPRAPSSARGSMHLPAPRAALSKDLARALAEGRQGFLAQIETVDESQLLAQLRLGFSPGGRIPGGMSGAAQLRCQFEESGEGTRLGYTIDSRAVGRGQAWGAAIFLALGVVALGIIAVIFPLQVLSHANPAVRGQTLQALQLLHFLWPPFLFAHLARRQRRGIRLRLEALLKNLPYLSQ